MDELYRSMVVLERKVDLLYDLMVKLDRRVNELLPLGSRAQGREPSVEEIAALSLATPTADRASLDPLMRHKDVLLDGSEWDIPDSEAYKNVSPELQIRRLTAQVTAAYGRIAALEEQLLARRVSSQS